MSESERSDEQSSNVKRRAQLPRLLVNQIKTEYLKGLGSIRELSEKYNVSPNAVSARCLREGWRIETNQVVEKVIETVEKVEVSRLKLLRSHEDRMIERMEKRLVSVDKTIAQTDDLNDPSDLRAIVSTESTIDQVIRRSLGAEEKVSVSGSVSVDVLLVLNQVRTMQEKPEVSGRVIDVEYLKECSKNLVG